MCQKQVKPHLSITKVVQQNTLDALGPRIEDESGALADLVMNFCREFERNMEGKNSVLMSGAKREISGGRHLFDVSTRVYKQGYSQLIIKTD